VTGRRLVRRSKETNLPFDTTLHISDFFRGVSSISKNDQKNSTQGWFFRSNWRYFAAKRFLNQSVAAPRSNKRLAFTRWAIQRSMNTCRAVSLIVGSSTSCGDVRLGKSGRQVFQKQPCGGPFSGLAQKLFLVSFGQRKVAFPVSIRRLGSILRSCPPVAQARCLADHLGSET